MIQANLFNQNIAEVQITYSNKVKASERTVITSSTKAVEVLRNVFPSIELREYFYILLLNRANAVLGTYQVSAGGTTGTVADPKIIFQAALKANACSIILAHNHPSGSTIPSDADIKLTKELKDGGIILDINIYDHLIIAADSYRSMADEGEI